MWADMHRGRFILSSWPGVAVRRTASLPLAYVPAIHVFLVATLVKTWMPGTPSAKTRFALLPGHGDFATNCPGLLTALTQTAPDDPAKSPARHCGRGRR